MTAPVITQLPSAPSRSSDESTFVTKADAFLSALPNFGIEANELAAFCDSSAQSAAASSNYKGKWADLSGSLSVPASVLHSDIVWVLLQDVDDVSLSEPQADSEYWGSIYQLSSDTAAGTSYDDSITSLGATTIQDAVEKISFSTFSPSQKWSSFTGQRLKNVYYTNDTGRPIIVSVAIGDGAAYRADLYVGGTAVQSGLGGPNTMTALVPADTTYVIGGTFTSILYWSEFR